MIGFGVRLCADTKPVPRSRPEKKPVIFCAPPSSSLRGTAPCGYTSRMKSLTEQLWFEVPGRRGFVNITGPVEKLVAKSGVQEGLCLVNAMHITASVFINDAEDWFTYFTR